MTRAQPSQLQKVFLFLFVMLFAVFIYTFLHEGGHALVGILSGGMITAFSVNFLDLSAHVAMMGTLTPVQTVINNLAGAGLPLLVWLIFMLVAPKRANLAIESMKVIGSLIFLNTLLAWIVLPVLILAGQAPSDDVTHFIINTGIYPLWVTIVALLLYIGGWLFFRSRIEGLRPEFERFRKVDQPVVTPEVRKTALGTLGVFVLCGLIAFSANGFKLVAPREDPFMPPPGYSLVKTIELSQAVYTQAVVHAFTLEKPAEAGVYLLIQDVISEYLDVKLTGSHAYDRLIVHAEGYTAHRDNPHVEESLQPGRYQLILTSKPSPGTLSIYTKGIPDRSDGQE